MSISTQSTDTHDALTALKLLQRGEWRIVGSLQSPEHEISFLRAIRREPVTCIGRYQVYMDTSREDRTTVFVHDPTGTETHKYILAVAGPQTYVIAAPMCWTNLHKNIVARVKAATALSVHCLGGGFVAINENGQIVVDGESTDYGEADHATAKAALQAAVRNSSST